MKILCDRPQLQEAFAVVAAIAPQKSTKPILQNIHLSAENDMLELFATDLDISCSVKVDNVKVSKPGKVLLPARETSALLRELSDPTVSLNSKEMRCKIESGGGSFVLVGDDPDQYPKKPSLGKVKAIDLPADRFQEMIRQTAFAAAREESRYVINGVLFDYRDECLRLVGTDGRRLALAYHNMDGSKQAPVKQVVPVRALQTVARAITDGEQKTVAVRFTDNQASFAFGATSVISRLLECNFPEYEGVIPKAAETTAELDRDLLEKNIRKVAVLSSGDMRSIRLDLETGSLEMSAESTGVGRADLSMEAEVKGAGGSISFNPDFLLEALKVTELETVRMDMTDDSTPAKMTLGEAFTYVLMPISGS